jgi:sugar phosphate isomerase/epimerase
MGRFARHGCLSAEKRMFKNFSPRALGLSGTQTEVIELALSNGFKGLELDVAEFAQQVQSRGLPSARRMLDSAKLKLGSFVLPVDWHGDDVTFQQGLEKLPPVAEMARDLGCLRAVTTVAPANDERPYHQNFEFHRRRFADLGKALAPYGIRLGVGFLAPAHHRQGKSFEFIHGLDALIMILGMAGQPNVGLAIDLWHLHVSGGGLEQLRKLSAQQIVTVSVADAPVDAELANLREESRLLPGETGAIDTAAALTALAEMGYDGPVTPSPHPSRFQGQRRDAIVKQTGAALDAVWKSAGLSPTGKLATAGKK